MFGCSKYHAYLRQRRRIVWDRSLTPVERRERLDALEYAYYGYVKRCCGRCRSVSERVRARILEPADAG